MEHATPLPYDPPARDHGADTKLGRIGTFWHRMTHAREAPRALDAAHRDLDVALVGRIGYYVDAHTRGRPIVLLHDVHVGASAYDVAPLFAELRGERPVYAPDLPGFGTSDRGPNTYCPLLYAKAIKRFVVDVASPHEQPIDVVALGLAAELVARVATEAPLLFRTLTLIAPTGLAAHRRPLPARRRAERERLLGFAVWALPAYRLFASRLGVARHLRRRFRGPVPRAYVDFAHRTARIGSYHAPFAWLAGSLDTPDAFTTLYARLRVPTLIVWDDAPGRGYDRVPELVRGNPAIRARRIEGTRGMPHFERRHEVLDAIRELQEETRRGEEAEARA
jgi:pimeloyl-ACP methyl ester carboxylesterase